MGDDARGRGKKRMNGTQEKGEGGSLMQWCLTLTRICLYTSESSK